MIDIRLDGESVDRTPGTELVLERFNPMFDFETVQGSRVYDFKLPDTPTNRRILGHPHHAQTSGVSRKFYCEKYLNGSLVEQGTVQIRESGSEYSLYFTQDLGQMFGNYQGRLLSELVELGSEPVPANPAREPNLVTDKYCFPTVINPSFYGNASVSSYSGRMNRYLSTAYDSTCRVPMFLVKWVLTRVGELSGWTFRGTWWDSEPARRLLLYNGHALDGATTLTYCNHLPALRARDLLIELRKLFNLFIEVDVRRRTITLDRVDDVLNLNTALDWTEKLADEYTKVPDQHARLALSSEIDSNDGSLKPVPALFDTYITPGTAGTLLEIKSAFSSLLTDPTTGLAMTDLTGFSSLNKESKGDGVNRLLYYIGTVNGSPVAANTYGNDTLGWTGANGLANRNWRMFESFRQRTHLVRRGVWLDQSDLAGLSFRNKVHGRGVDYVVGSVKIALGDAPVARAEVELWRW